ncbi:MAG: hypothetical protein V4857_28350 [Pseudomonadota bacterium]
MKNKPASSSRKSRFPHRAKRGVFFLVLVIAFGITGLIAMSS